MPSTVIKQYEYNQQSMELTVHFVTGKVYVYKQVPEEVYLAMKNAFAKGIFFNTNVRDKFPFEQVDPKSS